MAMNKTARRAREEVLRFSLEDLRGSYLVVDCGHPTCARMRTYSLTDLANFHRGTNMASLVMRLRCDTCKKPVTYARVQTELPPDFPRGQWVTLIGPEGKGGFR